MWKGSAVGGCSLRVLRVGVSVHSSVFSGFDCVEGVVDGRAVSPAPGSWYGVVQHPMDRLHWEAVWDRSDTKHKPLLFQVPFYNHLSSATEAELNTAHTAVCYRYYLFYQWIYCKIYFFTIFNTFLIEKQMKKKIFAVLINQVYFGLCASMF